MTGWRSSILLFLAASIVLFTAACGGKKIRTAKPPRIGETEMGIASWYGHPYHGRRAANGEIYDMEKLTAAHKTLPFETWVRVENLSNRKTVDLRITDRGPFVRGRIIDVSLAGARRIELVRPGIAKVRLTVIAAPENLKQQPELFAVQVGAYRDFKRAEAMRQKMQKRFAPSRIAQRGADPPVWRVLVGEEPTVENADTLAQRIRSAGEPAFVVRLDTP
jgi:rare lipoprotein A